MNNSKTFAPIAIVGQSCVLPGAIEPEIFWQNLLAGRDLISTATAEDWGLDPASILARAGEDTSDRTLSLRSGRVTDFPGIEDKNVQGLDEIFQWLLYCGRGALVSQTESRAAIL